MRLVMMVWCCFPPILAHFICYERDGFSTFLISWCPLRSTVSYHVFTRSGSLGLQPCQGFAISRDEYIVRELAFCDWTGHHKVLFKYTLPLGLTYDLLSEDAKTRVDRQTKTVLGLPFEPFLSDHNRHEFHPYHQLRDDVTRWCPQYLTLERWRLGIFTVNGLYRLFQEPRFSYPIVVLEGQGCRELASLPTFTVKYVLVKWVAGCVDIPKCYRPSPKWMPNACFGKNGVIVFWMRSYATNALMTKTTRLPKAKVWIGSPIIVVNAAASDISLNKLSPTGNGRYPWCMLMQNRAPCGLGIPCPRININSDFFQFYRQCHWLFTRVVLKAWIRMWKIYVTSMVINAMHGVHPTLSPSSQVPRALDSARLGRCHA